MLILPFLLNQVAAVPSSAPCTSLSSTAHAIYTHALPALLLGITCLATRGIRIFSFWSKGGTRGRFEELGCSVVLWTGIALTRLNPSSVILWKLGGMEGGRCYSGTCVNTVKEQVGEEHQVLSMFLCNCTVLVNAPSKGCSWGTRWAGN